MKNILILDNDRSAHRLYQNFFGAYNTQVFLCETVADATATIFKERIDLILTEHQLPDSCSLILLELVHIWKKEMPVFLITSKPVSDLDNPRLQQLTEAILEKPLNQTQLEKSLLLHLQILT